MKKICLVLALSLLLTGCGKKETPAVSAPAASASVEEEKPLVLEELAVEFLRHSADAAVLMQAVKELPQQLRETLAEEGVEVERVSVTMSGSCASTVQAVEEGGVDLAFLPVEELVRAEGYPQVALLAGEQRMDLYTTDTDYGKNLSGRKSPTWAELDRARWGTAAGEQAIELWLADHYEGNGLSDLADVTEYESREALYDAAAAGEIDIFPASEELEDFTRIAEGEPFYTWAALVHRENERLAEALLGAVETLQQGEFAPLFGPLPYQAARRKTWTPREGSPPSLDDCKAKKIGVKSR